MQNASLVYGPSVDLYVPDLEADPEKPPAESEPSDDPREVPLPVRTEFPQLQRRRTRIVATLGPSSRSSDSIRALVEAGVDVFRLNFSHGSHEEHRETFRRIREVAGGDDVAVLADLCGPKIRVGRFPGGKILLEEGTGVTVVVREGGAEGEGTTGIIPSAYDGLVRDVTPGDRILLDDGRLELQVEEVGVAEVRCRVVRGGVLRDRKGMNLPGVNVSAPSLTKPDRLDAELALELGVDFLALSFVRHARDVEELRRVVGTEDDRPGIIAKIEKPEALEAIEGILELSDGIMVARGDLGVELPPEEVPLAQSELVRKARAAGVPVIVATQMLESMVDHPRPTRAEVSDVAGAVHSGADAVMLSAETAAGAHPLEAVRVMDRVARKVEGYLWEQGAFGAWAGSASGPAEFGVEEAIARATALLSRDLMVRAIVVREEVRHGESVRRVSAGRPQAPVLLSSPRGGVRRTARLLWGVVPWSEDGRGGAEEGSGGGERAGEAARAAARAAGLASTGDHILEVGGFHSDRAVAAPAVRVVQV